MKKICAKCGAAFDSADRRVKYCSNGCNRRYKKTRAEQRENIKESEKKVQDLYGRGWRDPEIAKEIGYSVTYVRNIRIKFGLPHHVSKMRLQAQKIRLKNAQMEFRFCEKCGKVFYPIRVNQKFCCKACEHSIRHQIHDIKRKRLFDNNAEDITLDDVYRKYNGICYLCGGECDYNDYAWINGHKNVYGNYPSREHVIPISKGGTHTWDNVRLAHIKCNSSKGARYG